ncbi:MAG: OmpA family protein [Bacteroidota bacterium]
MKKLSLLFCLLILFCAPEISNAQKFNIFKNAKNKAENEVNKKVDKTIEGVFNPKKKKKEKETPTPTETPADAPANTNPPESPNSNSDSNSNSGNEDVKGNIEPAPELTAVKSDFVAGDKIIFEDDQAYEQMGEFPSKWDLDYGTIENAQFDGQNVIAFASTGKIMPLMTKETYLTEVFTIEFDCYFHRVGNEGYTIHFDKISSIRVNYNNAHFKGSMSKANSVGLEAGWRHVSLSFNQRALKVYLNGERVLNIPNLKEKPTKLLISALSHSASKGKPAMIKNIRIAEGGVKLYDRLMSEGKIITSDIHFDYNKATLKPTSLKEIRKIVDLMAEHPNLKISIEGHTDSDGSETSNQTLSEERAEAVRIAMINFGIAGERLTSKGLGESNPIDSNETHEGKARNRRVEFVLIR